MPPSTGMQVASTKKWALGTTVVVQLGYNDSPGRRQIERMVTRLGSYGVRTVLWVNLSEQRAPYRAVNRALAEVDRASEALKVLDWNAYSSSHPEWFVDGVHLSSAGKAEFLRFLRTQIAARAR